jgi:hypothetical protein
MDVSSVLFSGEMFENEKKHITVNEKTYHSKFSAGYSQICTRYHSKFSKYSKLQNITKKNTIEILILTLFTAFTTDRKFPIGKLLELGLSLRKLKFPSELPGCIAVLLAV